MYILPQQKANKICRITKDMLYQTMLRKKEQTKITQGKKHLKRPSLKNTPLYFICSHHRYVALCSSCFCSFSCRDQTTDNERHKQSLFVSSRKKYRRWSPILIQLLEELIRDIESGFCPHGCKMAAAPLVMSCFKKMKGERPRDKA